MLRGISWKGGDAAGTRRGVTPLRSVLTPVGKSRPFMNEGLSIDSIVCAAPEQLSCALGEESAILNLKNTVYYGLDAVGTRIWNLLQQPISVREMRDWIMDEYEVEADQCERDLLELLERMRNEGLIRVEGPDAGYGKGPRR